MVAIRVDDDAGGVDSEIAPYLFIKGVTIRFGETGRGLALVRAPLLMYSRDLKHVQQDGTPWRGLRNTVPAKGLD